MINRKPYDDGFSEMVPVAPSASGGGIGHNNGPEWLPIGDELDQRLVKAHKKPMKRADDLIEAAPIAKVENESQLKKATERVRQIQASLTELDGQRGAEKAPYRLGGAQVDGFFNEKAEELAKIKIGLERLMNAYNAKVVREAREKAARAKAQAEAVARVAALAAEVKRRQADAAALKAKGAKSIAKAAEKIVEADIAQDAAAEAGAQLTMAERNLHRPAAEISRVHSPNGVSSMREFVDFRNVDRKKIDLEKLRSHLPLAAIETAIRQYIGANTEAIKAGIKGREQPLAGVEFFINGRTGIGGGG